MSALQPAPPPLFLLAMNHRTDRAAKAVHMLHMIYGQKYHRHTLILNSSWELMVYIISVLSIFRAPSLHNRTS